jgi:hypothetical protein
MENFCEVINCCHKEHYYLKGFKCVGKVLPVDSFRCRYLDERGKVKEKPDPLHYPGFQADQTSEKSNIQVVAALVKVNRNE